MKRTLLHVPLEKKKQGLSVFFLSLLMRSMKGRKMEVISEKVGHN